MPRVFADRRLFLECEGKSYKLLSCTQRNDGSIYVGFPNFRNIKWIDLKLGPEEATMSLVDSTEEEGKLSFHATGFVHFRSHSAPGDHRLIIQGNFLFDRHNAKAGVRHLASIFMEKPEELPAAFPSRESDFWIQNASALKPFVLILFAVPNATGIQSVNFDWKFHIDDLESAPLDGGFGAFDLKFHRIVWFVYRTKFMDQWPQHTYICYHDGFALPLYLGRHEDETTGKLQFEVSMPKYEITGTELNVTLF